MSAAIIHIKVNEVAHTVPRGVGVLTLRDEMKPDADVVIHNGFPVDTDRELNGGDEIVFIQRGEIPSEAELEGLMVARHGPGVHHRVKNTCVGVAGCGGLGSLVAVALARTGVGRLRLADFDVVEPSNLNRQQFFVDQIGRPKVDALAENLTRINPYVVVETHRTELTRETIPEVFSGCDALAECFDGPAMKRDMTMAVRSRMPGTPLVTVSGIAGYGPSDEIRIRRVFEHIYMIGDAESEAKPGRGLLAPRVAVAAGHQANVILRALLGEA